MWSQFEERIINLNNVRQVGEVRNFLAKFDLSFDDSVDYTMGIYQEDKLVATGSLNGEVLRNIAIDETLQGEGLTAAVITHLMREAAIRGIYHYFIFTKVNKAHLFAALGFNEIARVEPYVVLLEAGIGSIEKHCEELKNKVINLPVGSRAGLVLNCNPFTLGHKAVVEKASKENDSVVIMVVSEERSLFPFDVRMKLVQEGLAEFKNVTIIPGGKYVISAATFPGYFTRGQETVTAQTRLDAVIYAKFIAKALGVTVRYVGEEPYCPVTCAYNEALLSVLPQYNIAVRIMPRKKYGNEVISASKVREAIRSDQWEELKSMVPDSTYQYLLSSEAKTIIKSIKNSVSRH